MKLSRTLKGLAFLALVGLGISIYLTVVYLTKTEPICGGSHGCATVENSRYAWLLGVPIPAWGGLLYMGLLGLTLGALKRPQWQASVVLVLFGLTLAGVLFSAYLTYLEFFVINAICIWCITSAFVMLVTFVLSFVAQRQAAA